MSLWDKISLYKFQKIDSYNSNPALPDIDKILFSTCVVFGYTEYELDNIPFKKVDKLTAKVNRIFSSPFEPKPFKRIGKYFINYEIQKITFGQYVELAFFLSTNPVQNAHYTMASVSNFLFFKNKTKDHKKKSEYFLRQPITKIMGSLALIIEKFKEFNKQYQSLFGLDKEVHGEVQEDKFNKTYGWIYSASQIAEYNRIPLSKAYELPVREAFFALTYLKAKAEYENRQLKEQAKYGR